MNFDNIKSRVDIESLISETNSQDGESSRFELKGTHGRTSLDKEDKKRLSKEISAFANTYGGLICFHFGDDMNLKSFPSGNITSLRKSLEGWLRDSLSPNLAGIQIKTIDDIILIDIPASKAKPHMATDSKYYYRHNTSSSPMPEIMISSLYRGQDYLEFDIGASFQKFGGQLATTVWVNNQSRIAGTKPRIKVYLAKSDGGRFLFSEDKELRYGGFGSFINYPHIHTPFAETTQSFADKILYPKDSIDIGIMTEPIKNLPQHNIFILEAECTFLQRASKSIYKVFEFNRDELIKSSDFNSSISSQNYFISRLDEVKADS